MAVPAYALVSLAEAKQRLGVEDDDRDAQLEQLIGEVSRSVMRETGREYAPAGSPGITRVVQAQPGSRFVDLHPYEARAVTAITVDPGGSSEAVMDAAYWRLGPVPAADGVYDWIELSSPLSCLGNFHTVRVAVTGTWGWADVPDDVKGWTLDLIEDRWKRNFAVYADAEGIIDTGSTGPVTIPYRIRDEMESVRRIRLGSV